MNISNFYTNNHGFNPEGVCRAIKYFFDEGYAVTAVVPRSASDNTAYKFPAYSHPVRK